MTRVGRIASSWRYPVKSMAGERLEEASVTLQGIQADRMYAFVQAGSASPFPWLTGRELPSMMLHKPVWTSDERPKLSVRTPAGAEHAIGSEELRDSLEAASGREVFLLPNYRGSFDVAVITLMSTATVAHIADASDTDEEPQRFRMNFYVETDSGAPWGEDAWVGNTLKIGAGVRVAITERDKRCAMITLAPHGGDPLTKVLTVVAEENDATAGIYGSVLTPGIVRDGDDVTLED